MLSALFLVLLPLPETRNTCAIQSPGTIHYSLAPFSFVKDILKGSSLVWLKPTTYFQILKQRAFFQAAYNFLLLLPLGVYLRYFFQKRYYWKRAFVIGFSLSLFYEVTQLTGIYGIYKCPYRLFDVDDLILNSSGSLLGFLIAPIILALFPSKKSILAKTKEILKKNRVSPVPQLLALLIDTQFIHISCLLTVGLFVSSRVIEIIYTTIGLFVVLFIVPLVWKGKTIGSNIMKYKLIGPSGNSPSWQPLLKRFVALYLPWMISKFISVFTEIKLDLNSPLYSHQVWLSVGGFTFVVIMWSVLFIHAIMVVIRKGDRLFYFDHVANLTPRKK
ncbi:VanZ family protein [Paenibacillus sp. SYP-B3998]|nr:VanZ family protein [Paenibacillus sp. SYP-B3998]